MGLPLLFLVIILLVFIVAVLATQSSSRTDRDLMASLNLAFFGSFPRWIQHCTFHAKGMDPSSVKSVDLEVL